MRSAFRVSFAVALLACGCDNSAADDTADSEGEPCPAPVDGVAQTYELTLTGFPEVVDNVIVDELAAIEFQGACTVSQLDFAAGQLALTLACEHPESTDATVTLTTAASGLPVGLSVDASVEFSVTAFYNQGGDASGGVFRSLSNANYERYAIIDDVGLVFAAVRGGVEGSFDSVTVEEQYDCPGWAPCASEEIAGSIRASSGEASVDVEIGEVQPLEDGARRWDVSLFQARLGGCHGNDGGFSVVRGG